jgi:hypothetical protein
VIDRAGQVWSNGGETWVVLRSSSNDVIEAGAVVHDVLFLIHSVYRPRPVANWIEARGNRWDTSSHLVRVA